jgi:uncharacterized protein YacL
MANAIQIILLLVIVGLIIAPRYGRLTSLFGKRRKIILDSCALIDGRVVEVVNSGFVADELVIPQFILNELQLLADGNDSHKRERARFGLDIAHQLQDASPTPVVIDRTVFTEAKATDDKLILLARRTRAVLCTTDYNLGKVAAVEGIHVLNINELAQGLRPVALPGETLKIKIIQKGSNRDQGVGYLDDGTMIVVDGAARHINKVMPVTVTRMHQTVAGKMVFGQIREDRRDVAEAAKAQPEPADARHHRPKPTPAQEEPRQRTTVSSQQGKLHSRLQRFKKKRTVI